MGIEALNPFNIIGDIFKAIFHIETPEQKVARLLNEYKKDPNSPDAEKKLEEIKKTIGFDPETGVLDENKLKDHPQFQEMADAIQQMEGNGFSTWNIMDSLIGSSNAPSRGQKMGVQF